MSRLPQHLGSPGLSRLPDKARRAQERSFALRLALVSTLCLLCTALWLFLDRPGGAGAGAVSTSAEQRAAAVKAAAGGASEPVPEGADGEEAEAPVRELRALPRRARSARLRSPLLAPSPAHSCSLSCKEFLLPPYHTHTRDQPFLRETPAPGLPPAAFARLRRHLLVSPLLTRPNGLDEENFGATSGFLAFFSAEGASVLRDCPLLQPLSPFFDAVRLPRANAFTLNALTSRPSALVPPPAGEEEEDSASETSAGVHVDNTLSSALPLGWNGEAHQTDVLYVQIPADMRRGTLQLWQPDLAGGRESSLEWRGAEEDEELPHENGTCRVSSWYGPPRAEVHPEENKLVSFRGDSFHRVLKHGSSDPGQGGWRVSLVLEQYLLQEGLVKDLPAFHIHAQDWEEGDWAPENEALQPCRHLLHRLEDLTYEPEGAEAA